MDSLCHSWFTTTNLSYRFPIFETSATALCGTTGVYIYIHTYYIHMFVDQIHFWSHHKAAEQCWTFSTCHFQNGGQCWPHWHSLFFSAATLEIACHIWWFLSEVSARGSQLPCGKLKMKSFSNQDICFKFKVLRVNVAMLAAATLWSCASSYDSVSSGCEGPEVYFSLALGAKALAPQPRF